MNVCSVRDYLGIEEFIDGKGDNSKTSIIESLFNGLRFDGSFQTLVDPGLTVNLHFIIFRATLLILITGSSCKCSYWGTFRTYRSFLRSRANNLRDLQVCD